MTVTISADQARRLVLSLQGLAEPPRRGLATGGLAGLIERLGFVQVDSINTVARAHHMILFARNQTYRPALLKRLHEDERALFEHWTDRIASLLPIRFYPYWRLRFAREQALGVARARLAAAGPVIASSSAGRLALGGPSWWVRLASVLPLVVLIGGLLLIERGALEERIEAAAEIDTALLSDDLPPMAYVDPGFVAFLKTSQN
jgi:uncharacterized protein YcaQ